MHRFKQKFIPWVTLSEPVRVSGLVACKPPREVGDDVRDRRNWVNSLQPARLVGQGENPPLVSVQFYQVVVGVEEGRNL